MSRMIMNFEAVTDYAGESDCGVAMYEVKLMVNHHVIYRWPIDAGTEYLIRERQGHLEREVSRKLFELLHPVKDVTS